MQRSRDSEIKLERQAPRQSQEASLEEVMTEQMTAQAALDRLETLYTQSVTNLRDAVRDFVNTGERPDVSGV
jgi:AMP nucleosidase